MRNVIIYKLDRSQITWIQIKLFWHFNNIKVQDKNYIKNNKIGFEPGLNTRPLIKLILIHDLLDYEIWMKWLLNIFKNKMFHWKHKKNKDVKKVNIMIIKIQWNNRYIACMWPCKLTNHVFFLCLLWLKYVFHTEIIWLVAHILYFNMQSMSIFIIVNIIHFFFNDK